MTVFNWQFALEHVPEVLKGVPITLLIAVVAILIGSALGLGMALARIYKVRVLHEVIAVFVSFIRGTPLLVQLYVFFLWRTGRSRMVK